MSSPNPWIYEPETGRWYMNGKDESGRSVRQYAQSSSKSPYQNPSTVPRTLPSSSRRSSSKAPHRRGSESSRDTYRESKQTQPARNASHDKHSKQYHNSGEYSETQDTRSSQRTGYTPSSSGYDQGTPSYEGAQNYGSSSTSAPIGASSASIAGGMNSLSLDDRDKTPTVGYGSSAPVVTTPYTTSYTTTTSGYSAPLVSQGTSGAFAASRDAGKYGTQDGGGVTSSNLAESQNEDHRYVTGTPGESEKLDPRYQVRNHDYKKFFKAGRVFSTLWTVPASGTTNKNETFISFVKYGEKVHTKIRRFVVVNFKQSNKRCTCLPVTSYEGRGYKKPDIDPEEHGPIYSSKKPPKTDSGVTKKPLKVILSKNAEPLRDPSLVNYGCIYTVETNVKVMDVGVLDEASLESLEAYYREVNFSSGSPTAVDTSHQRKDQYLTGVGSSFGPSSSIYDNRMDSMAAIAGHNRTVSFSTQPNSYSSASTDNTYRVPIGQPQSQTGYSNTSYNPQSRPESSSMTSSSTYPINSNVQYSTTPLGSTGTRYSNYGNNPPATTNYSSTEGSGSNQGFSPTSETSGYNYTTQPQTSVSTTPYSRGGYTDNRTSYQSMGTNPSSYQTVSPSGGQDYSSYATNPRSSTSDNNYSYTSPPAVSTSYSSRTQPAQTSYGDSTYARNEDDRDIELPTHSEIAASRQQRPRRESVSKPSRHEKSGGSRHHDRSDRDRKERRK